ncbi:MAG: proliferating cell nuclear antigen (pcna) [Candidatus Pacearchaeota archaeon]
MKVKLENPGTLAKTIDLVSELVTEVRLKLDESGMSLTAIDPANVAMVRFLLRKDAFTEFDLEDNEKLGVNLEDLKKILKRAGSKSTLSIEKNESSLNIEIQDRVKRKFTLGLIDIDKEEKEMPSLEFSARVEISSTDLTNAIEDCAVVSEACSFLIENQTFVIEAKGMNSARSEFTGDEATIHAEDCKSRYSLEYLQKFMKGAKMTSKIALNFANDHPLKMDIVVENMEINFVLAPRVETED